MFAMRPLMSHSAWSHARNGVVQDGTVLPIGGVIAKLPGVLDAVGGAAQQQRLEIHLHRRFDEVGALGEGGAAIAVEARLVGGDLDHRQAHAFGGALYYGNVRDPGRRHAAQGMGDLRLGPGLLGRQQPGGGGAGQRCAQNFTPAHYVSLE